jgi:hypothetical protein
LAVASFSISTVSVSGFLAPLTAPSKLQAPCPRSERALRLKSK